MNRGYIKAALALLSVAGYIQNIAFASEHVSTTIPSNRRYKPQLFSRYDQSIQRLNSIYNQGTQQLDSRPNHASQRSYSLCIPGTQPLFSRPNQASQRSNSLCNPDAQPLNLRNNQATQQLNFRNNQGTQQLSSRYDQAMQRLNSICNPGTQPLNSRYSQGTQQLNLRNNQATQQLNSRPNQASQRSNSLCIPGTQPLISRPNQASQRSNSLCNPDAQPLNLRNNQATQQLNSEPNQATQQLNSESNQPPQQLNTRPTKIIQQLNSEPNQITHQLNSEPNQVTQQAHFIPIGFKQREYFNPIEFKHQLYLKSKEAEYAEYIMAEALDTAKKHAIHTNDYNLYYNKGGVFLHFKRVNDTDIGKLEFTIPNANNYGDIVKMLWDPNGEKGLNTEFIEGKVSRMYSKNLSIIQRRYKGDTWNRYYYAMANKVEVSRDETVILLVSSDMNDHSGFDFDDYINSIVESANSFTPDMDSEEDIREGKLAKFYINLIAFFIKKRPTDVKITHLSSIDHEIPTDDPEKVFRQMTANSMLDIVKLRDIFKVTNPFPYGIF